MTIARVALPKDDTRECGRCGEPIAPPEYEADVRPPVCFTCKKRPCEGWSAYCHECQCHGGAAGAPAMCKCGASWTGGKTCHCATCHLTFGSVHGFDAHRRQFRCLTETELRDKGYEPNDRGHWRQPAPEGMFTERLI